MALFIATKARVLVTLATAGTMMAGVVGLQAEAVQQAVLGEAESAALIASAAPILAPTPTAIVVKKKKKKKRKPSATVFIQQPPTSVAKPAQNDGTSAGSK